MEPEDLRPNLSAFVAWRHQHLKGDEKGEAQTILDRLFKAFGHEGAIEAGAVYEDRVKRTIDYLGVSYVDLMWKPRLLVEMKKAGADLSRHFRQAFEYWQQAVPDRPRYVVLCNFDRVWVYDFDQQLDAPMLRGEHGIWAGTSPKDATLGEPGWRLDAVLALDDYIDD